MDFRSAITAHAEWKQRLKSYVACPDGELRPEEVERADQCELGRWLLSDGREFTEMPEFQSLVRDHAEFHKAAADVVRRANAGDAASDDLLLGAHSAYAEASRRIVVALVQMKTRSGRHFGPRLVESASR